MLIKCRYCGKFTAEKDYDHYNSVCRKCRKKIEIEDPCMYDVFYTYPKRKWTLTDDCYDQTVFKYEDMLKKFDS